MNAPKPAPPPTRLETDDAGNLRLVVRTDRQLNRFDLGLHVTTFPRWWKRLKLHLMQDWIALEDLWYRDSGDAADSHDDYRRDLEFGYRQDTRVST